jgi:phthalate 4,5-dioxygenase oxygenase subunit
MKLGSFTGIRGIPNQDIAMWETMGPIADRTHDRLGASDLAIVEFRRTMVEAAQTMRDEGRALGAGGDWSTLRSFEGVVPKTTDWRTLGDVSRDAHPAAAD